MLSKLSLTNFRNFSQFYSSFSRQNIIYGANGQGKTNIIESIFLITTARSFRTLKNQDLVKFGESFARIEAEIKNPQKIKIELIINLKPQTSRPKTAKIEGVKKKLLNLLGIQKVILFSPESLAIIFGSPSERRRFLDNILIQVDFKYAQFLLYLAKILKNRNLLLERINQRLAMPAELSFWDAEFVKYSSYIIQKRQAVVLFLNKVISDLCQQISGKTENLKIEYLKDIFPNQPEIENFLKQRLAALREKEILTGHTLVGPHRDNLIFNLNGKNLQAFGSRGETRTVILALKLAEAQFLTQKNPLEKVLFLLDDVFSELDPQRRDLLTKILDKHQIIITCADLRTINPELRTKSKIIRL